MMRTLMRWIGPESPARTSRIRQARTARGWTQARLAEELGLHQTAISKMEAGTRRLTVSELRRMAEVLGVDAAWLGDLR